MKIRGNIDEIRFRNEENGYTIAVLDVEGDPIIAVGTFPPVNDGEDVEIAGENVVFRKFQISLRYGISCDCGNFTTGKQPALCQTAGTNTDPLRVRNRHSSVHRICKDDAIAGFRCFCCTASGEDGADQQRCKNSFHIATSFLFGSFILIWKNPG